MRNTILTVISILLIMNFITCPEYASMPEMQMRFSIGSKNVRIDRANLKVQTAPYIANGVTMVPVKIIAEALDAGMEYDKNGNFIRLSYRNNNIKFLIGKAKAVINGVEKPILSTPKVVNGSIMVPLRVITENFNIQMSVDSASKEVVIHIPLAKFEDRFKYISENKIGDSYYGWSMLFPKGSRIMEKDTSGTSILVRNQTEGYYCYIYIVKLNHIKTENDLLKELLSYVEGERLVSQKIISQGEKKWASVILEDQNEICEYRAVIHNERIYQIHFYTQNKDEFMDSTKSKKYLDIINSFDLGYKGVTKGIWDINEISNGFYTYREEKFGWTIDLVPALNIDIKKADNVYQIINENGMESGATCGVEFYSLEEGETLSSYVYNEISRLNSIGYDFSLSTTEISNLSINGIPAVKLTYEVTAGEDIYTFYDLYLIDEKYKYNVFLFGPKDLFSGKNINVYDRILKSFNPVPKGKAIYIPVTRREQELYM